MKSSMQQSGQYPLHWSLRVTDRAELPVKGGLGLSAHGHPHAAEQLEAQARPVAPNLTR